MDFQTSLLQVLTEQGLELLFIHDLLLFCLVFLAGLCGRLASLFAQAIGERLASPRLVEAFTLHRAQKSAPVTDYDVSEADWVEVEELRKDNYRRYHS